MGKKVQVLFVSLNGELPAGQQLPLYGRMLLKACSGVKGREAVLPISAKGVAVIIVFGDLANPGRLGDLALHGAEKMMHLGDGDEVVMLQAQVDALGLAPAIGVASNSGALLTARDQALYDMFAVTTAA